MAHTKAEWKHRDHPMYAENWRLVDCATEEILAVVRFPSTQNSFEAFIRGGSAGEWESCRAAKRHVESRLSVEVTAPPDQDPR